MMQRQLEREKLAEDVRQFNERVPLIQAQTEAAQMGVEKEKRAGELFNFFMGGPNTGGIPANGQYQELLNTPMGRAILEHQTGMKFSEPKQWVVGNRLVTVPLQGEPTSKVIEGHPEASRTTEQLYQTSLEKDANGNPTQAAVQSQAVLDKMQKDKEAANLAGRMNIVNNPIQPSQKDFFTFEELYPQWKNRRGTPEYANAYIEWWKDQSRTSFAEKVQTGQERIGTPEQLAGDVEDVINNRISYIDLVRNGGMGGWGAAYGRQVREMIRQKNPYFNYILQSMAVKGDQAEINKISGMRGQILSFENTAIQNAKQVYGLASKIDVSRIPAINDLILKGETSLAGDPVASNYMLAWRTFVNEYARVSTTATGGGITTDQSRKEMEDIIRKSSTPEMIQRNMMQAVLEMKHREYGFDKQAQDVYERWGGRSGFEAKLPTAEDITKIFSSPTPDIMKHPLPIPGAPSPKPIEKEGGWKEHADKLTPQKAKEYLDKFNGDRKKAEEAARKDGYKW